MKTNIIFSNQHPTILYAAHELEAYLERLNLSLPFSITLSIEEAMTYDGMHPVTDPVLDDQYYLCMKPSGGFIIGSNPRSILLGVYAYLYQIGFRFLQPDRACEFIPVISSPDSLYLVHAYTAPYRHRGVCLEGACSLENIIDFITWMPKVGFNCFFVQFQLPFTFLERWYHHEQNPFQTPEPFSLALAQEYDCKIELALAERSLIHHRVGHGWTCEVAGYPSFGWMEASETPNPAHLAKLNGKRQLFHGIPLNTNLCYSDPEVIRQFTDTVITYALAHPGVDYLHVWLADEHNNICECEECQKTTPADQYVHLLNCIDQELTARNLPTKLVFLLYQELLWTPKKERFNNPDRFTLMFAPISRTFMTSYPDTMPEANPSAYCRNQITLPTNLQENLSFLSGWQQIFGGDSFVYDYPLGRAHYGDLSYLKIAQTIYEDIHNLSALHLDGYISCQELRAALPNGFPNYVMAAALTDCTISYEALKEDYYRHAYGDDYRTVLHYLETLSKLYDCDYYNRKGPRINPGIHRAMAQALTVIDDFLPILLSHVSSSALEKYYWDLLDYHREYSLRLTLALYHLSCGSNREAQIAWDEFHTYICQHEAEHQSVLDVYRITEVSEKYTGFSFKAAKFGA